MHVSCGYSMRPCTSWTGTPVSLPAQQPPWPVTLHMAGVSKDGQALCMNNRNCSGCESGLLDTVSL